MDNEKWAEAYYITCIKKYKTLRVGESYKVEGRGNLEFNFATEVEGRTGFGVNIRHNTWPPNNPMKTIVNNYYLDLNELNEYFCTDSEDEKSYIRDSKIKSILN